MSIKKIKFLFYNLLFYLFCIIQSYKSNLIFTINKIIITIKTFERYLVYN